MDAAARSAIEAALGARVLELEPLRGGDINDAYRATLAGGRRAFVKTNRRADAEMFPAEARGLDWLREAGALRIPLVLAVSSGEAGAAAFLALEYLEPAPPRRGFDEELGRGLAALHRYGAPFFGLDTPNFIGRLPQPNTPAQSWPEFFRDRRLEPQLRLAEREGRAPGSLRSKLERLYTRLAELVGPPEPPARLHGDLWGGNLHGDDLGAPCLIDPAVYGGHREVDLAMMKLFGGFGSRVFAAYAESYPLAPGYEERVELYQLYPLFVHLNLFGGSYLASVERAVTRYL
jgi:fructosamine-3-kinase